MPEFIEESGSVDRAATADQSRQQHLRSDVDVSEISQHHTLGRRKGQASPGPHQHLVSQQQTSVPLFFERAVTSYPELLELLEEYGLDTTGFNTVAAIHMRRSKASNQTINTGTVTTLGWGQEDEDLGDPNNITYDSADDTWTVPIDCLYLLQGQVQFEKAATTTFVRMAIRVNGTVVKLAQRSNTANIDGVIPVMTVQYLQAGDEVSFTVTQNSGGNLTVFGDPEYTQASVSAIPGFGTTLLSGGGGGVSDHGALTGLADNDHPQYEHWVRDTYSLSTGSLPDTVTGTTSIELAAGFRLLAIDVSHACRVRLYKDSASRTADSARPIGVDVDIATDHGLIFEYVATGAIAAMLSPLVDGYALTSEGETLYIAVQNLSGATNTIFVDLDWIRTE